MKNRNFGFFKINRELVEEKSSIILEIFIKLEFLPIRIEYVFEYNAYTYYGISPFFEYCEIGRIIPEYTLSINTEHNGEKNVLISYSIEKSKW